MIASQRIFLFKLAKPDYRRQLIIDSGFRCHVTQYSRTTATTPSHFVTRLRKALKSRRVTSVEQIGTDRIIDFSFSDGMYHLFLEFFAGGNIILTDREYNILAVFRTVLEEDVRVGLKYTVTDKQNYHGVPDITAERIRGTLEKAQEAFAKEQTGPKKSKKKGVDVLRKALSQGFPEYPPLLLDHAFAVKEFDSATPLAHVLQVEGLLWGVFGVLEEARSVSEELSAKDSHPGYIIAKEDTRPAKSTAEGENEESKKPALLYEDFHPFKPRQFAGKPDITILEFDRFNATIDEYFSSLESQKLESRLTEREEAAKKKLDAVRQEHQKRLGELEKAQDLHIHKAGAIEDNVYRVQEAMDAVNGLIAQGMDWVEIERLVEMEQSRGNPVAKIIKLPLKLHENTITLLLGEAGDVEDEDEKIFTDDESEEESEDEEQEEAKAAERQSALLTIDIDLGLTPWANATQYYEQKKVAAAKQQKTAQSSTKALKSHEKKVTQDLKRGLKQEKQVLHLSRNPFWFEKFLFFISSEGYLVLGGRDAMQSEMLYRRQLKKGDIFVNADLQGARPMVVKNRPGAANAPIPPSTLSQAGNLCVSTSSAWDSKAVMPAYWVEASQVTKTGPGGIVPTGEFIVNGEKNFLAPSQLVLGFGVAFQVSKESLRNHKTGRFDIPEVAEGTLAAAEPAEREEFAQELITTENPKETGDGNGQEQEQGKKQDTESDEEDPDQVPAKNPLQRGLSEAQNEPGSPDEPGEKDAEGEDQRNGEAEQEDPEEEVAENGEKTQDEAGEQAQEAQEEDQQLSARERHALRKEQLDSLAPVKGKPSAQSKQPAAKRPPAPTRGKKAKNKKAAAKYADQDEDERELALRVLGGKSAKAEKAEAAAAAKEAREREAEAAKKRRKAQHERAAEAERKRQALFEADDYDEETAAAEAADLSWIPALVGTPHPEDEIVAAIPICAPWAALGRYKYRVKLQPGAVKKGKAVKEILGRWVAETTTGKVKKEQAEDLGLSLADAEKLRAREGELIKAWKETEIINTVPVGKVRIMGAAGGSGGGDSKGKGKSGNPKGGNAKGGKGGKKK